MQSRRNQLLCATRERDYKLQHWIEMLALPRQNTIMPLSGLLHRVRRFYDFCLNIGCFAIEKRVKQIFSTWILLPVITKLWTPCCMNLSCYWSCLHHRLCNMHTIWCLHYVVEIWREIWKMAKYVVDWFNSIRLFNKQPYIVPVNPIVIIFCH